MCRIAAFSRAPGDTFDAHRLSVHLLRRMEPGGPHAAGCAYTAAGSTFFDKVAGSAAAYAERLPMDPSASAAILHTRWATKGSPEVAENNHPIVLPGLVGVHNGIVYNDAEVRSAVSHTATAEVDSEALFAAIAAHDGFPERAFRLADADAAVAWLTSPNETSDLHVARWIGRPLAIAFTRGGSAILASTTTILGMACAAAGISLMALPVEVPEGCYLRLRDGVVVERRPLFRKSKQQPGKYVRPRTPGISVRPTKSWGTPPKAKAAPVGQGTFQYPAGTIIGRRS